MVRKPRDDEYREQVGTLLTPELRTKLKVRAAELRLPIYVVLEQALRRFLDEGTTKR